MEFIAEFILEVILEGIFAITVENPKVKTWIKTVVFLVVTQLFTGFLVWITIDVRKAGESGWIVGAIFCFLWFVGTCVGAVCGHKRNWIKEE